MKLSIQILDLATGNHELYMRRRREQTIEIQQMKYFEEQQQKVKIKGKFLMFLINQSLPGHYH